MDAKGGSKRCRSGELAALKLMAMALHEKSGVKLKKDLEAKILIEVCNDG